ncbi:MAG TPA: hypothetical protein DCM05_12345 [Elusimicrobia bacterium]|nr:hypothetical protein [Elusimicrobiota bacterium]
MTITIGRRGIVLGAFLLACGFALGWVGGNASSGAFVAMEAQQEELDFGQSPTTTVNRRQVLVPNDYGNLFAITGRSGGATLWYQSGDAVRNVALDDDVFVVKRQGSIKSIR